MFHHLINLLRQRSALARRPDRLLRDIGVEVDPWRLIPAPCEGGGDVNRLMVMAPLRS